LPVKPDKVRKPAFTLLTNKESIMADVRFATIPSDKKKKTDAKPFLKWAGGKRQLLNQFEKLYPASLKAGESVNYYEPFVGGGAVFFDVMQKYNIKNAYLYDINDDLILTYRVLQKDVCSLIEFLSSYSNHYKNLTDKERALYYYEVRRHFNSQRFAINYRKYSENWFVQYFAALEY